MASRGDFLPPVKKDLQSRLLMSRRWSSPGMAPPLDLFSHYINGVNVNDAMLREHRKLLCKTADGRSRAKHRAAYEDELSAATTAAMILAWSRGKYKAWKRRHPQSGEPDDGPEGCDDGHASRSSLMTRKGTVSRTSARSRESLVRMRSRSTLSLSDTEEEKPKNIRTFWWYCGVIKAVCKLALDMQRLSMRKTEQTALSEMYYVSVTGAAPGDKEDNQILFFDKTLFTRKRAACRVPEWAQNLMIRKPEQRKPEEIQHLKHLLMSMRSFREKYTDDMRTKMCEVVRYTRCDKGRVVLRQGHAGHYFYFIFSGSVFIQIDLYDARTGQTTPSTENIIRTGESFGEIALLGDGIRSASVICREPTELCQIDKSTFLEICPALFQKQLDEKIQFARGFELFANWEDEQVKQLCFLSQVLYIPHGRVIELDWSDPAQYVYFVMRGRISMIKEFDVNDVTPEEVTTCNEDWAEEMQREEEEERYNVLAAVVSGSKAARLVARGTLVTNKRFACVGTLREGQSTDLRILSLKPPKIPSITLLSEGVRVLRVAARNFSRYAPRRQAEEYLKKRYTPMTIPSTKALVSRYMSDLGWRTFRKRVMDTLQRERDGHLVASMPATSKGTSGWARWPGFDPFAEEKCGRLSERGARSKTEDFPIAVLPRPRRCQQRADARSSSKGTENRPSLTVSSQLMSRQSSDVTSDRTQVLFPPAKKSTAFLRKSLTKFSF